MKGLKVKLKPTPEQEKLMWQSVGVNRFIWNFILDHLENHSPHMSESDMRKFINHTLKQMKEYSWLKIVSQNVIKEAVKLCYKTWYRYLKGEIGRPKYKARYFDKPSFYVNYESIKSYGYYVHCEKLGRIQLTHALKQYPKYYNPHIVYEKDRGWYLTFSVDTSVIETELSGVIGVDLGLKEAAIVSNGLTFPNINKTQEVIRLEKKLKRVNRKLSRQLNQNILSKEYTKNGKVKNIQYKRPLHECLNYQKTLKIRRRILRRLSHIRENHNHHISKAIVNLNAETIVMEKLNIKGMMKNKHLSRSLQNMAWFDLRRMITYKAEQIGAKVHLVDTFYPSSKLCSNCGNLKKVLKLSERTYQCDCCHLSIDRDLNAAINLANAI